MRVHASTKLQLYEHFNLRISFLRPAFVANHFQFWFYVGPLLDIYHFMFDFLNILNLFYLFVPQQENAKQKENTLKIQAEYVQTANWK